MRALERARKQCPACPRHLLQLLRSLLYALLLCQLRIQVQQAQQVSDHVQLVRLPATAGEDGKAKQGEATWAAGQSSAGRWWVLA